MTISTNFIKILFDAISVSLQKYKPRGTNITYKL